MHRNKGISGLVSGPELGASMYINWKLSKHRYFGLEHFCPTGLLDGPAYRKAYFKIEPNCESADGIAAGFGRLCRAKLRISGA